MTKKLTVYDDVAQRFEALDPLDATALPIPAFQYGPVRPAMGQTSGQAFIETSTGVASVWDGTKWTQIAKPVITPYADDTTLLQRTPADGTVALASNTGNVYTRVNGKWLPLGIRVYPNDAARTADSPADGTIAFSEQEGTFAVRIGGAWAALDQTTTVAATEPTGPAIGDQWFDTGSSLLMTFDGTVWQPPTPTGLPVGIIQFFAGNQPPTGWLVCNGDPIPTGAQYQALIGLVGSNTPNLMGMFIRGNTPDNHYVQKDDTTRKPRNTDFHVSGNTSNGGGHRHMFHSHVSNTTGAWDSGETLWTTAHGRQLDHRTENDGIHHHSFSANVTGGDAETAPKHVNMLPIIRAF